jgi:hypothetical protein
MALGRRIRLRGVSAPRETDATGPQLVGALQQRPAPEDGDYFHADWLRPYDSLPPWETLKVYGASDYAVTADGGDYTVHIVIGIDPQWRMYVLDLWRAQTSAGRPVIKKCPHYRCGARWCAIAPAR